MAKYDDEFKREVALYVSETKGCTAKDAADKFNVGISTVKKWIKDETLLEQPEIEVEVEDEVEEEVEEVKEALVQEVAPEIEVEVEDEVEEVEEVKDEVSDEDELKRRRYLRYMGYI